MYYIYYVSHHPSSLRHSSIHSWSLFYIFLLPSFYILSFHSLQYSLSLSPFHPPCILSLPSYILYMGASTLFTFLSMTKSFSLIATSGDLSITKMSHCSAASFYEKRYPKFWLYACKNCAKYLTLQKSSFASSLFNWEITQPLLAQVLYVCIFKHQFLTSYIWCVKGKKNDLWTIYIICQHL